MEPASPQQAEELYVPQVACPHPVYLINDSDEDLDVTITINSNTVTERNAYILKAILAGLTGHIPCHDLDKRTDKAIVSKFKEARLQFTIKPHDNLLLSGLTTGQKITLWKKRLHTDVFPYELPMQDIKDLLEHTPSTPEDRKTIVKVLIKPSLGLGFDFQNVLTKQENHNLNPLEKQEAPLIAVGDDIPVCLDPVRLFNKGEEDLDIRVIINPNSTITKNGNVLQFILTSLTASLNHDDMNGIMAHNIQDKFKKAEFDFTIHPGDNLLLPGIASKQQIIIWKKRCSLNIKSYDVPLNTIEQALSIVDRKETKNTVNVFIKPHYLWGFNFDVSTLQEKLS